MSERIEKFKALWDELSPDEKAELLAYFESHPGTDDGAEPGELSEEWIQEIDRRLTAYKNGETKPIDGAEFMAKMKAKYG